MRRRGDPQRQRRGRARHRPRGALLGFATPVAVVALYVLLKHSARQLVPPDNVAAVAPGWRPVVGAHLRRVATPG